MMLETVQHVMAVVFCAVLIVILSVILVMVRKQNKKISDLEMKMKAQEMREKEAADGKESIL